MDNSSHDPSGELIKTIKLVTKYNLIPKNCHLWIKNRQYFIKKKIRFSFLIGEPILAIQFRPFGFIAPKAYLAFQSFDFERT
jgi:hypothetical protein